MKILDCRRHRCPQPVVETRKRLLAEAGEPLRVLVGDDTARENVSRFAGSQGYDVQTTTIEDGFSLELSPAAAPEQKVTAPARGETVVFISGEVMGSGNDELGRILLKNFLFTLAETDSRPDTLLFVNAGVKLACEESEAIEAVSYTHLRAHET